jgi:hypothetical protein
MAMDWLWQGLTTEGLGTLGVLAVGGLIAWMKRRGSTWVQPLLYGLAAATLIAVMFAAWVTTRTNLASAPRHDPTTIENAEARVRQWSDELNFSVRREQDPATIWSLLITYPQPQGMTIKVARTRERGDYLTFLSRISLGAEHAKLYEAMPPKEKRRLERQLILELARSRTSFNVEVNPLRTVIVVGSVPIVGMTKETFRNKVDEVGAAKVVAFNQLLLALDLE